MPTSISPGIGPAQRVQELLSHTGDDLPILRRSCQGIIDCTDDDTSSANDVGEVIMQDQALLAKIIKLANSALYHVSTPVTSALQAVKIIGFDVIRAVAIGAEFIELAGDRGENATLLKKLLARALVAATAARELEEASKFPKDPNLFTSTMLYTLGDLVLAYYLPDTYRILESAQWHEAHRLHTLEAELLGQPLNTLAAKMGKEWGLSDNICNLIQTKTDSTMNKWQTSQERLSGLVCSTNEMGRCLLSSPTPATQHVLKGLLERIPQALNIPAPAMKTIIINAFKKAAHLSTVVNIDQRHFVPNPGWESPELPKAIRQFIREIWKDTNTPSLQNATSENDDIKRPGMTVFPPASERIPQTDFAWLQDFTLQALATSDPNHLLQWATEKLHSAGKFERVVLIVLAPETGILEPRTGYGKSVREQLPLFRCAIKGQHLFASSCRGCETLKIDCLQDEMETGRLPQEFLQAWGDGACLLGPLFARAKPVGLIIADMGVSRQTLTPGDFANFAMVLGQVNVNLTRLAMS